MSNDKQADLNGLETILTLVGHLMYEGRTMLGQKCVHTTLRQTYTHNKRGNFTHMMGYSHSSHVQSCNDLYGIVNEDILVDHHRVALAKHNCFKRFSRHTHRVEENLHSLSQVKCKIFCIIFQVFLTFFWTLLGIFLNLHDKSLFGLEAWANLSQTEGVL